MAYPRLSTSIQDYIDQILPTKSTNTQINQLGQLKYWVGVIGGYRLNQITPAMVVENLPNGSPATKNRYIAAISGVLRHNEIILKFNRYKEPRGRVRYLSTSERDRLLESCRASDHPYLYTIVVLAISTGMRKSEITSLTWNQVDLNNGQGLIYLTDTKNDERRMIPLVGHAYQLISELEPLHSDKLFPGRPIKSAWYKALKDSGITNFRFHDCRHHFCSIAAMSGVPLYTISQIVGHKSLEMTRRYSHLSTDHIRGVLENLDKNMFS